MIHYIYGTNAHTGVKNLNTHFYIPKETCYKNIIQSIWQVERPTSFHTENIIPKGVIEIIFNLSEHSNIMAQLNNEPYRLPACFINGFNTIPIKLMHDEQQLFLGVTFQPTAVKKIFRNPAHVFSGLTVDLALINPVFRSMWQQLGEQDNFDKRVNIILNWLDKNFVDPDSREQAMDEFLHAINQHGLSVKELATALYYSPRHLSRKIFEATGMNTEEILLYKKYLHAVHLIHHTQLSLTAIAYRSQFSDQSHLIKTFRAYARITPGDYKRNKAFVKGHIYGNVR